MSQNIRRPGLCLVSVQYEFERSQIGVASMGQRQIFFDNLVVVAGLSCSSCRIHQQAIKSSPKTDIVSTRKKLHRETLFFGDRSKLRQITRNNWPSPCGGAI